jgi:hypothetical protein
VALVPFGCAADLPVRILTPVLFWSPSMLGRRRIWFTGAIGAIAVAGAILASLGAYRGSYYKSLRQYDTLICVGRACLQYQLEKGSAPASVEDVVRAGLLRTSPSAEYVDTYPRSSGWGTLYRDALRVEVSFPALADEYELRGDLVVKKATGEPVTLVNIEDGAVWPEHVRLANKYLARLWLKLVRGEPMDGG